MVDEAKPKQTMNWRRWYRRSNLYIAEYIATLLLTGILLGILSTLWFTFFKLLVAEGYDARTLAVSAAASLGALVVVAPAAYWAYSRVTGEEMVNPAVIRHKARTVFLTIWTILVAVAIVGIAISMVSALMSVIFGVQTDVKEAIVGTFVPGLFVVPTLIFGMFMIGKRTTRTFAMKVGVVLAGISVALFLANGIMIFVKKDASTANTPSSSSSSLCNYSAYADGECSYTEYRDYLENSYR